MQALSSLSLCHMLKPVALVNAWSLWLKVRASDISWPLLHTADVSPVLIRLWATRDLKLQEVLVLYVRLQVKLQAIQNQSKGGSLLDDFRAAMHKEIRKGGLESHWSARSLSKAQDAYLRMFAEVEFQYAIHHQALRLSDNDQSSGTLKIWDAVTSDVWVALACNLNSHLHAQVAGFVWARCNLVWFEGCNYADPGPPTYQERL